MRFIFFVIVFVTFSFDLLAFKPLMERYPQGLLTKDYGILTEPMQANMVFTVEPGIYIPAEGFGIRLEDNVVIQEKGSPFNLMRNIPIEVEEIESLMNA